MPPRRDSLTPFADVTLHELAPFRPCEPFGAGPGEGPDESQVLLCKSCEERPVKPIQHSESLLPLVWIAITLLEPEQVEGVDIHVRDALGFKEVTDVVRFRGSSDDLGEEGIADTPVVAGLVREVLERGEGEKRIVALEEVESRDRFCSD